MYTVYHIDKDRNTELLYTPEYVARGGCTLIDPELNLELNTSGTFTATIPRENDQFDKISVLKSRIVVFDGRMSDDDVVWKGRVISVERDFWGNKTITAEGELSYFADYLEKSFVRYGDAAAKQDYIWTGTVARFWELLISHYNASVCGNDKLDPMYIPYKDENGRPIYEIDPLLASKRIAIENKSFTNGMDMIMNELIEQVGGYVWFTWTERDSTRARILHHSASSGVPLDQQIRFGENMLDINECINGTAIYTSIVAEGPNDPNGVPYTLDKYHVPDAGYSISGYGLCRDEEVALFGRIEHYEKFDSAVNFDDLYRKAKAKLDSSLAESMTINVKAADLHFIDQSKERFRLGSIITCVSEPHGLNDPFKMTAMRIPLSQPEAEEYTLGLAEPSISMQERMNTANLEKLQKNALTVKSANKANGSNNDKVGYINIGDELLLAYGYTGLRKNVTTKSDFDINYAGAGFVATPVISAVACCGDQASTVSGIGLTLGTHIRSASSTSAKIEVTKTGGTNDVGVMWIAVGYPKATREDGD